MANDKADERTIVDFLDSDPVKASFQAPALLEGYWHGLCQDNCIPFRSDLDPRAIESVLEFSFVLERLAPGVCRIRLAGRHLNDLMGQEVRGMPVTALFEPDSRKEISRLLEEVCNNACLVDAMLKADGGFGRGALTARLFMAPLLDDRGQVTRVFGCLQSNGTIGRQPRRFSMLQSQAKPSGARKTDRTAPNVARQNEFSEPAKPFLHKSNNDAGKSDQQTNPAAPKGLRLVVDNS